MEDALRPDLTPSEAELLQDELANIDRETRTVAMRNSDLYFMLRYHLDRTRSRLAVSSDLPQKASSA